MARSLIYYLLSGVGGRIITLLAIPVLIKYLGIEAFGLIGFYLLLTSSAQLAEMGIGTSIARRISQLREKNASASVIRKLSLNIGIRYFTVVITLALILFGPAQPWLVAHIEAKELTTATISTAITLMGIAVSSHLIINYLINLLIGLEKHTDVSVIRFVQSGLLQLVSAGIIMLAPGVTNYFIVQVIGLSALALSTMTIVLVRFRNLPAGDASVEETATLGHQTTMGIAVITILGFFFSQIDRITLSGSVPLDEFGYYSLAFSVVNAVNVMISPIFSILLPVYSRLAYGNNRQRLWDVYRRTYIIMQALLIPAVSVLVFMGTESLWVWTGDPELSAICTPLMQLLAIGILSQGLSNSSWLIQLGLGKLNAEIFIHVLLVIFTPIFMVIALGKYGLVGAALSIAGAHTSHLVISMLYVNTRHFQRTPFFNFRVSAFWLLSLPVAAGSYLIPATDSRILQGSIIVALYAIPAAIGLGCAVYQLRKATTTA